MPVFTLLVDAGRGPDDRLPEDATGAALLCHAPATDEAQAVRETVELLRTAGFNPIEVQSYGTPADRQADGRALDDEDRALIARAEAEDVVIVAEVTPFWD